MGGCAFHAKLAAQEAGGLKAELELRWYHFQSATRKEAGKTSALINIYTVPFHHEDANDTHQKCGIRWGSEEPAEPGESLPWGAGLWPQEQL